MHDTILMQEFQGVQNAGDDKLALILTKLLSLVVQVVGEVAAGVVFRD